MFENLNTEVISPEDLLIAMGGEAAAAGDKKTDKTEKADKGTAGKDKADKTDKTNTKSQGNTGTSKTTDVADLSDADLAIASKGQEEEEEEEDQNDQNDDNNDDDKGEEDKDKNKGANTDDLIPDFIKSRVLFLINNGEWSNFEIDGKKPEDIEWDEDTFADMELQQRNDWKATAREEIVDSYGPYGRMIADHIINGGNPDELIDIFKEQQEVKGFDISNESGQEDVVFKYETEVLGKNAIRVKKDIARLKADGELEAEAKEAKTKWEGSLKNEEAAVKKEAADQKKAFDLQAVENQRKFVASVTKTVTDNAEIQEDEKKQVIDALTKFTHELPNGMKVNKFYNKLADFKKNLPDYIDLVRFVLNKDKFIKTVKNTGKSQANEKAFKMLRTSAQKTKTSTSTGTSSEGDKDKKRTGVQLY